MKLYRPVGLKELLKIIELGFKGFPPRLQQQPIFYPVINEAYADEIALKWNTLDSFSDFVGYVLEFDVKDTFISKYQIETVGNNTHKELWIPSEELEEFNINIVGTIKINRAFYGMNYIGIDMNQKDFVGKSLDQQFDMLVATYDYNKMDYHLSVQASRGIIICNYHYWKAHRKSEKDSRVLDDIFEVFKNEGVYISG